MHADGVVRQLAIEAPIVDAYAGSAAAHRLTATDTLDGGDVLPGFTLKLAELFAELD